MIKMTGWSVWVFCTLWIASRGSAATFIGNGGQAGDLDLAVSKQVLTETLQGIHKESTLCSCTDAQNYRFCGALRALTDEQKAYCQEFLISKKEDLLAQVSGSGAVQYQWSNESLFVATTGGEKRLVDAVAQVEQRIIILSREGFLKMPLAYRVALLGHELIHFLKINDQYISDEGSIGPFQNGQAMLDVLGAAMAVESEGTGQIAEKQFVASTSKSYRKFFLQVEGHTIESSAADAKKLLKSQKAYGSSLKIEYRFQPLTLRLLSDQISNETSFRQKVKVKEKGRMLGVGVGYALHPINTFMSRWNETTMQVSLDYLKGDYEYEVAEQGFVLADQSPVSAYQLVVDVRLPLIYDFWAVFGMQMRRVSYNYSRLGIKGIEEQRGFVFGGAYGF